MIELTEQQRQAIREHPGQPLQLTDPTSRQAFVLIPKELYERLVPAGDSPWTEAELDRLAAEAGEMLDAFGKESANCPRELSPSEQTIGIPPGIRRSQEAFWRDLPELLTNKKNHGKWVCYHLDERIGIARTEVELIRECLRRGLRDDEYDLNVIEPRVLAPWEPEEIEGGGHVVDAEEDRFSE